MYRRVRNEQFAQFVDGTGYVTVAERTPRAEDFPGAPLGFPPMFNADEPKENSAPRDLE
jgi:hypothetical protein